MLQPVAQAPSSICAGVCGKAQDRCLGSAEEPVGDQGGHKSQQGAEWKGQAPSQNNPSQDTPSDIVRAYSGACSDDGGSDRMRGAQGDAKMRGAEDGH